MMLRRAHRSLAPEVAVDHFIRRELLTRAAQASYQSNLMGLGLIALIVLALWAADVRTGLLIWAAIAAVNVLVFHVVVRGIIDQVPTSIVGVRRQETVYGLLNILGGLTWGCLPLLATPGGPDEGLRAVVCTAVMVAMAGNLAFASPVPLPFRLFHVCLAGLAAVGLLVHGTGLLALVILFAAGATLPLQKGLYLHVAQASLLARQNELLVDELRAERATVEQTNLRLLEVNAELAHRATRDPLTGLANRLLFSEHLNATLRRHRDVRGHRVAVIFFDLDRFKLVNDTYGHGAGDELLCQVAERVTETLRESDVLSRFGGDEFVALIMAGAGSATGLEPVQRILDSFQRPFTAAGRTLNVTTSMGVAFDDGISTSTQLLEQADAALYRAKEKGRNRFEVFDASLPLLATRDGLSART